MSLRATVFACALAAFSSCGGGGQGAGPRRARIAGAGVDGISALARDGHGRLWMAPDHDRWLLWLAADGTPKRVRLEGVSSALDVESLAYLGGGRFALGTEPTLAAGGSDFGGAALILFAALDPARRRAQVTGELEVTPGLWDLRLRANEGIEGLCRAGRFLVAGIETVIEERGRRYAPIAVYDLKRGSFRAHRLRLSTRTGTLSGLACRWKEGSIRAIAIERHFGVTRLLAFTIQAGPGELAPRELIDLDDLAREAGLNFEGIELAGGSLLLAVDNEYKTITGPNELVYLPLPSDWWAAGTSRAVGAR